MNNFELIQEHFTQLHCPHCNRSFTTDSVKLIREEEDYWVVKVSCNYCNESAGIAIVGIEFEEISVKAIKNFNIAKKNNIFSESETKKFDSKPPITSNDVIEAHKFIKNLGSDWMKYLKKSI